MSDRYGDHAWYVFGTHDDAPTVCVAHGCFIPCRKDGPHLWTDHPRWVGAVREFQAGATDGLTWEPAS